MISTWRVQQAARAIRAGAVIAYPTEAVWGLGCDPWDEDAVERLLAIKSRPVDKVFAGRCPIPPPSARRRPAPLDAPHHLPPAPARW